MSNIETTEDTSEILETRIKIPMPAKEGESIQYVDLKFTRPNADHNTLWTCWATNEFIAEALEIFNNIA